ncbi:MAG: GNAT family N-acetyltransferase [Candidatus Poribacteria bacterium]|nr:GNAT family N-acetyltransferase [Candidatus Poribacteria bacterium]
MGWEIRPVAGEDGKEFDDWATTLATALSRGRFSEENISSIDRPTYQWERSLGAIEDSVVVGTAHSYRYDLIVPGGKLPFAGVGWVSVRPTHRRRGILTALMKRQLEDMYERGETLATLGSSESIIYGRYGYGIGAMKENWRIERKHTAIEFAAETSGRTVFVSPAEMREIFPGVYERVAAGRPGMAASRPGFIWDTWVADYEPLRRGSSAGYYAIHELDGEIDGYVCYRTAGNTLIVRELLAASDAAYAALWQFCFGVDLKTEIEAPGRAVDEQLVWMLADPRRLERIKTDGMWIRLVDVKTALSGRRYAQNGRLVIEVQDPVCPWNEGYYELDGGPAGAECRLTKDSPDLVLSATNLASTYLGTIKFSTLYCAGHIEERSSGALARADSMFSASREPWCILHW